MATGLLGQARPQQQQIRAQTDHYLGITPKSEAGAESIAGSIRNSGFVDLGLWGCGATQLTVYLDRD